MLDVYNVINMEFALNVIIHFYFLIAFAWKIILMIQFLQIVNNALFHVTTARKINQIALLVNPIIICIKINVYVIILK